MEAAECPKRQHREKRNPEPINPLDALNLWRDASRRWHFPQTWGPISEEEYLRVRAEYEEARERKREQNRLIDEEVKAKRERDRMLDELKATPDAE